WGGEIRSARRRFSHGLSRAKNTPGSGARRRTRTVERSPRVWPIRMVNRTDLSSIRDAVDQRRLSSGRRLCVSLRRDRRPPADIVIELDDPAELFEVDQAGLLEGSRRIDTGIDELVERLLAQKRIPSDQRIILDIADDCSEEVAEQLVEA